MHTLYRCFGINDLLLYVGLTCNPGQRFSQHRDTKAWWRDIERITLEQYPDRQALVDAERAAIVDERPLYNIVMNRSRVKPDPLPIEPTLYDETWTFRSLRHGDERPKRRIELYYEIDGSSISDEYSQDEIGAHDLLRLWWRKHMPASDVYELPREHAPIFWYVVLDESPGFEGAPFCVMAAKLDEEYSNAPCNFLTYFTWPTSEQTRDRLNWLTLPVQDKAWNERRATKGGFIQEATGWKPSPFQSSVDIVQLAVCAGLHLPVPA